MVIRMIIKTYRELSRLKTFEERYKYLQLKGVVGESTFGFDRIFNQLFYTSGEWRAVRKEIIIRDNGCDLGIEGYDLLEGQVIIHHMNPISIEDIENRSAILLDPNYLITTTLSTHNAIHYGDVTLLSKAPIERTRNDMCPWKK